MNFERVTALGRGRGECGWGERDFWFRGSAHEAQGAGIALFDERAEGLFDDPFAGWRGGLRPTGADVESEVGMVFGDVVEVIGDGAADVEFWIVF